MDDDEKRAVREQIGIIEERLFALQQVLDAPHGLRDNVRYSAEQIQGIAEARR